ncbi:MAG: beta-ketoacyl-[acyl-carrier-protein] synthase family protein [Ferrovum sp.]|nr:beta-ketoacyl-[acyl-carrier-protein] synthase family protein [Ferrovum sp.]
MSKSVGRRVAVTGIGLVSPFGGSTEDFFERLMGGESAVRLYRHPSSPDDLFQPAVCCASFSPEITIGRSLSSMTDRFSQLGLAAAFSAWSDAGFARIGAGADDFGVSWGTGAGGALTYEKGYLDFFERGKRRVSPLTVALAMHNAAASNIAIALGLGGSCLSYSVACASSAVAIGEAYRRIQSGESRLMIAGGSEAPLSLSMMLAWNAMRVVAEGDEESAYCACRPFQEGRTGLVLGEGGAALVLEDWNHAVARGARIYCELAGYGQSCDHSHLVRPDAVGQIKAIKAAMEEAELSPATMGYVNAHGTATQEGDPIEIEALRTVFGADAADLAVSSTKSMHGHLLGAAGAMEAAITVLAVARQEIPPTAHLQKVSADCQGVRHVMGCGLRDRPFGAAISNSFAFGGSNAVLAFRQLR